MGQRGAMRGEALMQCAGGDVDVAQELARLQHVGVVAGDEVDCRHLALAPIARQKVQRASSAVASVTIGPAGRDMQILPPTVAAFQILNEARKAREQS